ncbi:hypothetical protein H4R19_002702, partial [Coemansia spiralis]
RALDDLAHITQTPHSINDVRSIAVRDYLRAAIRGAIDGSDAEFSDPLSNGTIAELKAKGLYVYWEDSSLAVRVPGTDSSRSSEALLVQAHYDAVPLSHGAFDDGVGVAVCLELLRSLVGQRTRHPVVINIDWGEENGLYGARLFARFHPWAATVRAYINLEAGGVGGRAMLFRASHSALLRAYRQAVSRPCASLIGNDAFKLGIIKSDTDYSVYTTRHGIPGLDLAFTDRRSLYHTARDSAGQATAASVLSMGTVALATARQIADSAHTLRSIPHALQAGGADRAIEDTVFYDVLSRVMVVRSYSAELWINLLTGLIGIATVVAVQFPFARPLPDGAADPAGWAAAAPTERLVLQLGRGGLVGALLRAVRAFAKMWASALFGSLVFTGGLLSLVAPRLAYTHPVLLVLLLFAAAALSATCVLSAWVSRARLADGPAIAWYALCVFRCLVLLAIVVPLNWASIGLLYREQIYAWAAIVASVLTALMDPSTALGAAWHRRLDALASWLATRGPTADGQRQRLLDHDDLGGPSSDDGDDAAPLHRRGSSLAVAALQNALPALRLLGCVLVPMAIGMDAMLRQLVAFKDHLVDGSPPLACTAIAAVEIATFVQFLAPVVVGVLTDADGHWLVRCADTALEPWLRFLLLPGDHSGRYTNSTRPHASSRSQISLHTNYDGDGDGDGDDDGDGNGNVEPPRVIDYPADSEHSDSDIDEHIIVLGSGTRRPSARAAVGTGALVARRREPPEMVGMRMVYAWTGVWLLLWVVVQLAMLTSEGYDDDALPLKVRAFHTTRMSAECLRNASSGCALSQLALSSPDSAGLARLVELTAPKDTHVACFTQSTRDFYRCNLHRTSGPESDPEWSPESAINITSIRHTPIFVSGRGTLFNVTIVFSAPETRTCFIDLGHGYSPQSYPNPRPVPAPPPASASPVIGRTVLPVIERARLMGAGSSDAVRVAEPVADRDPVFAGRILAHKREFDDGGLFVAEVHYLLPGVNTTRPAGATLDISCYFDQAERHTPLLASIIGAAPGWATFTPAGNTLSTVTVAGIEI